MRKNIIIYGLIAGIIVAAFMLFGMNYLSHCNGGKASEGTSMLVGFASMLLAFSLVFVGIRNYRDKYNGGAISFGQAFKIGAMIALIASTIYVATWLVDNYFFIPDFAEKYAAHQLDELKGSGASQAVIDKETVKMANFVTNYKNPLFRVVMTYAEILPLGLIVALISSLILKRKATKPMTESIVH